MLITDLGQYTLTIAIKYTTIYVIDNFCTYLRRKSAGVRMRGIIDKVLGTEPKSKSCDDLYVL